MTRNRIYLDRNENNYGPAPACYEALRRVDLTHLSWYDRSYVSGIRGVLTDRLARDFGVSEDRVLLGYGAEHILKQTIQCYLTPGRKLMVPAYSWWYYKKIASEVGGLSVEFPMTVGTDRFIYDIGGMRDVYAREHPAVVFISSPNNPTGNSLAPADMESILAEFDAAVVVLDEAYIFGTTSDYVRRLIEEHPRLLVVRTMSKYYALAGVRIGYALMGKGLTALAQFSNRYLGFSRVAEDVALAALDSPAYYRDIAAKMEADKERYYSQLGRLPGFRVYRSDANFILAALAAEHKAGLKAHLERENLFIKFMDEPLLNSHVRITIGTQEENRLLIDAITAYYD